MSRLRLRRLGSVASTGGLGFTNCVVPQWNSLSSVTPGMTILDRQARLR